jgi:hypothetical protein
MPMFDNQHISLCRRFAGLTKPTLRFPSYASLLPRRHARIPLVARRTSFTAPSSSKLVLSGELEKFPLGFSDFSKIRQLPGLAYFDKTEYIPVLEKGSVVQLVCRPRRFGKSLIVSMLQYFHGFQFRTKYNQLFKDLDVNKAVQNDIVQPGRYLVLHFDFSRVARPPNIDESVESLERVINRGLLKFIHVYKDLGESFASITSGFIQNDPAGNLTDLVEAVDLALQGIHDRGEKDHPLFDVHGVCLF